MPPHQHQTKRKHIEEPEVDDLLVASAAASSAWSPPLGRSNTSDDDSSNDTDIGANDASNTKGCKDIDEISIDEPECKDESEIEAPVVVKEDTETELLQTIEANLDDITPRIQEDSDDESDIDLTENLANMEDDEDDAPKKKDKKASRSIYQGPKTEHELDPYQCPIPELEKLSVCVSSNVGGGVLDGATRDKLKIAGVVRSYLVEQRTIVVDSLIPASLRCSNNAAIEAPLDEGSVMAIVLSDGSKITTLEDARSVHILGKVVEVFGPVQRPLYVIRLPDPPRAGKKLDEAEPVEEAGEDISAVDAVDEPADGISGVIEGSGKSDETNAEVKEDLKDVHRTKMACSKESSAGQTTATKSYNADMTDIQSTKTMAEKRKLAEFSEQDSDPWSINGKLSIILCGEPAAAVYSVIDHSTLVNKDQIIKISGKGCDASNMFDEEVGPSEQQDFSDDEDERQAKRFHRKPRQNNQTTKMTGGRSDNLLSGGRSSVGKAGGRGRGRGRGTPYNKFTTNSTHIQQKPCYHQQQHLQMQHQYYDQQVPYMFQQDYHQYCYQQYIQRSQPISYHQHAYQPGGNYGLSPGYSYGAPPPPPPPIQQNNAGTHRQEAASQNDTVYYDYSGS